MPLHHYRDLPCYLDCSHAFQAIPIQGEVEHKSYLILILIVSCRPPWAINDPWSPVRWLCSLVAWGFYWIVDQPRTREITLTLKLVNLHIYSQMSIGSQVFAQSGWRIFHSFETYFMLLSYCGSCVMVRMTLNSHYKPFTQTQWENLFLKTYFCSA